MFTEVFFKIQFYHYCFQIVQVTELCTGELPSSIDIDLFSNGSLISSYSNILVPKNISGDVLTVHTTVNILEDQRYTIVVSFNSFGNVFDTRSIANFGKKT